jgi:hypothetical protein
VAKTQRKIIAANCAGRGQMSARSLSEAAMDKHAETLNCAQSESNPNLIGPPSMRRTLWFTQRPICAGQLPHDGSVKISAALSAVNLDANDLPVSVRWA